jgi:hypothetical protein
MRFRNQYIITTSPLELPDSFVTTAFGTLQVHANFPLRAYRAARGDTEVLLLGYVIDPLSPATTDQEIADRLAAEAQTREQLFRAVQGLSGRFVALFRNGAELIALTDACGVRQMYYSFFEGNIVLTSSVRLFADIVGKGASISAEMNEFIHLDNFDEEEHALYSDESIDSRMFKVLPNHYLDIDKREVHRIPVFKADLIGKGDIAEYTARIVEGGIEALHGRFDVIQPLTAGWDSRVLLACSRKFRHDTRYYIFDLGRNTGSSMDVAVSRRLASRLGLGFDVITPDKPGEAFADMYAKEQIVPRVSKIEDNHYLYSQYANGNAARISGVASAIIKSYYGYTNGRVTPAMLQAFTYYPPENTIVKRGVARWFDQAEEYCREYGLRMLDLFHWEEKEGNWGALAAFEQDVAVEEFWPQANRNLLVSVLRLDPHERCSPKCLLYRKVIDRCWPEVMAEPINPAGGLTKLKRLIKRSSKLRYYNLKLARLIGRGAGRS